MSNEDSFDFQNKIKDLSEENSVLKFELNSLKVKINTLINENKELKKNSVSLQAKAEQEEEFISNTLLKQIHALKKEKETLALNYEQEEEFITNELSRKLFHLQQEKLNLERTLEREQETQISKLNERINKLESDVKSKQESLEILKKEKIQLENTLEQEQEALLNKLWKKMERLEKEKKFLKTRLESVTNSPVNEQSPICRDLNSFNADPNEIFVLSRSRNSSISKNSLPTTSPRLSINMHIDDINPFSDSESISMSAVSLHEEVKRLRGLLFQQQKEYPQKIREIREEEMALLEENRRLKCHLQREVERRHEMSRNFSESESSLEMDEEKLFNDRLKRENANNHPHQRLIINTKINRPNLSTNSFPNQRTLDELSDCEMMSSSEYSNCNEAISKR